MQIIPNGPDVPDELLQAFEEGRAVFFCGAGISCTAKLPLFRGLVNGIREKLHEDWSDSERKAYDSQQFDAVLEQVECRLRNGRQLVRGALFDCLSLPKGETRDVATHKALLQLSGFAEGRGRLVTTNYDRLFIEAAGDMGLGEAVQAASYQAPLLPIPRASGWDGLCYLHGLLPEQKEPRALNDLILTSADFGRAYLRDQWAARFVTELFRHYAVCFVGYSLNDAVMRYLVDALAADRALGEALPEVWAFADYSEGQKERVRAEWEAKKVRPILYATSKELGHTLLHSTLREWARLSTCLTWREDVVCHCVKTDPQVSSEADDVVGRLLWALSDEEGLGAKRLAFLGNQPSFEWVKTLSQQPLDAAGHPLKIEAGMSLAEQRRRSFTLMKRPFPDGTGPLMGPVFNASEMQPLDSRMKYLCQWLSCYWQDPQLVEWVEQQGHDLDWCFRDQLQEQMAAWLEKQAPTVLRPEDNAVPGQLTYWLQKLNGAVERSEWALPNFFEWVKDFKTWGLTAALRLRLRDYLSPRLRYRLRPRGNSDGPETVLFAEVVLLVDRDDFSLLKDCAAWQKGQWELLPDYELLLGDALRLLAEVNGRSQGDPACFGLPSISNHSQNRGFEEWTILIELLREAWLSLAKEQPKQAVAVVQSWMANPHPTFQRLALFVVAQPQIVPFPVWGDWLLQSFPVTSPYAKREICRLFVQRGAEFSQRLQKAILSSDLSPREVWLYLGKLQAGGARLTKAADRRLAALQKAYPSWCFQPNEREEFAFWLDMTGDVGEMPWEKSQPIPRELFALMDWLRQNKNRRAAQDWSDFCHENAMTASYALTALHGCGIHPVSFWQTFLYEVSPTTIPWAEWIYLTGRLLHYPKGVLKQLKHAASSWLEAAAAQCDKTIVDNCPVLGDLFVQLTGRLLGLKDEAEVVDTPLWRDFRRHSDSRLTAALLVFWLRAFRPQTEEGLPENIGCWLTAVARDRSVAWRGARQVLAAYSIELYLASPNWTKKYLRPLFSWEHPEEAGAAWRGFLGVGRVHPTWLSELKSDLLLGAEHLPTLGEERSRYASFMGFLAVRGQYGFSSEEFRQVLRRFSEGELALVLDQVLEALASVAEDKQSLFWRSFIGPFFCTIWPHADVHPKPKCTKKIIRLLLKSGDFFPEALKWVSDWLQPLDYAYELLEEGAQSPLCKNYPHEMLTLLHRVVKVPLYPVDCLQTCLEVIGQTAPDLMLSQEYLALTEMVRRELPFTETN